MRLHGRVVLVTGAAAGIGRAVVTRFLAEGARVVACDRSARGLELLQYDTSGEVLVVQGDVTDFAHHEHAVSEARRAFGRVDVVVANAGVFDGNVSVLEDDDVDLSALFDEVFRTNVGGYIFAARAAAGELRLTGGSLVMTASIAGLSAGFGGPLYVSAKHAVIGLMRRLAVDFAPDVRVNAVAPGYVETGLSNAEGMGGGSSLAAPEQVRQRVPLQATPRPDQVTGPYVLLASDEGRFMTGSVLTIDGGQSLTGPGGADKPVSTQPRRHLQGGPDV